MVRTGREPCNHNIRYMDSFYTFLMFYGSLLPSMISAETHRGLVSLFPTIYKSLLEHTYFDAVYKSLDWIETTSA